MGVKKAVTAAIATVTTNDSGGRFRPLARAMATVTAFFTPIGHHGNLLIYGPGGYQFSDFVKVGVPLTFIVAVIVSLMAPMIWPG